MKIKIEFLLLFLILFSGIGLFSWAQGPPPTPVVVSPVLQRQVRESVVLMGTATPRVRSLFAAEVEGLVKELYADEGDTVKKGQVLAKLGSSILEIQLEVARAARNEATERYLQAKAEMERSIKLRRSESISEKKFLDDRFEAMAWEKRVKQREAQISKLEDLLAKKTIIAPFSVLSPKSIRRWDSGWNREEISSPSSTWGTSTWWSRYPSVMWIKSGWEIGPLFR